MKGERRKKTDEEDNFNDNEERMTGNENEGGRGKILFSSYMKMYGFGSVTHEYSNFQPSLKNIYCFTFFPLFPH